MCGGLFLCDLLSVLPTDYVAVVALTYLQRDRLSLAWWRLNRLFGLVRVASFLSQAPPPHAPAVYIYTYRQRYSAADNCLL